MVTSRRVQVKQAVIPKLPVKKDSEITDEEELRDLKLDLQAKLHALGGNVHNTHLISVRVSEEYYDLIKTESAKQGMLPAVFCRYAIIKHMTESQVH